MKIRPISDLRNYTDVLKTVDQNGMVYLTRNGSGAYAIMTIEDAENYERLKALQVLLADLKRAEARADKEGWISESEMNKILENTI